MPPLTRAAQRRARFLSIVLAVPLEIWSSMIDEARGASGVMAFLSCTSVLRAPLGPFVQAYREACRSALCLQRAWRVARAQRPERMIAMLHHIAERELAPSAGSNRLLVQFQWRDPEDGEVRITIGCSSVQQWPALQATEEYDHFAWMHDSTMRHTHSMDNIEAVRLFIDRNAYWNIFPDIRAAYRRTQEYAELEVGNGDGVFVILEPNADGFW